MIIVKSKDNDIAHDFAYEVAATLFGGRCDVKKAGKDEAGVYFLYKVIPYKQEKEKRRKR